MVEKVIRSSRAAGGVIGGPGGLQDTETTAKNEESLQGIHIELCSRADRETPE